MASSVPARCLGASTRPVVVFVDAEEALLSVGASGGPGDDDRDALGAHGVAVVLCTSMTRAQTETIQQTLGLRQPFICESGAAILIPNDYFPFAVPSDRALPGHHVIEFGRPYDQVVELLHRTAARLRIPVVGFSDQSVEEVARSCGLSLSHARLAKLREYDEPFRFVHPVSDERHRLWRALGSVGLSRTFQNTYEHVGAPVSARVSVNVLTSLYRRAFPSCVTAGVGSGPNSAAMLRDVQVPFVAETRGPGSTAFPLASFPRLEAEMNRSQWFETMIELARRVCLRPNLPPIKP